MRLLPILFTILILFAPAHGKILCKGKGISVTDEEVKVFKSFLFRGFAITDEKACQIILKDKLLAKEAERVGLQKRKDTKLKLELLRARVLARAYSDSLSKKIKVSDREIKEFYERNKGRFREPIRVRIVEYRFKEKRDAEAFLKGKNRAKGKDMGYLVPLQIALLYPSVSKDIMDGRKRLVGPFKKGKELLVLEVKDRKGGGISPLTKELKDRIRRIIKNSKEREILEELVKKLKEKYGVSCTF